MTKEGWAELLAQTNSRGTTWLAWCKAKNMLELTENTSKWDPYMVASFVRQREAWRNASTTRGGLFFDLAGFRAKNASSVS